MATLDLLPGAGSFVTRLASNPRTARWIVPTFAAAFRGTADSTVEPATRALVLLRVAAIERCPYWRTQWEPAAQALGIAEDQIVLVGTDDWEATPAFEPRQRAAILWADRIARRLAQRDAAAYSEVSGEFSATEVAELTLVASLAAMAVRIANALRIAPEGPAGLAPGAIPLTDAELAGWSTHMFDAGVVELAKGEFS